MEYPIKKILVTLITSNIVPSLIDSLKNLDFINAVEKYREER